LFELGAGDQLVWCTEWSPIIYHEIKECPPDRRTLPTLLLSAAQGSENTS